MKTVRSLFASALVILGLLAINNGAHGQALYTADKGADIFVFGGYNYTTPDYGPDGINNTGFTLGGDYTRYFGWSFHGYAIDPSLELRITDASGEVVKERTGMGGIRVHTSVKDRYHPYFDLLAGLGVIDYATYTGYPRDHGLAYSFGGGIDIDLVRHFQLKLDYQLQSWNLGPNAVQVPAGGNYTLSPRVITIGVSYHIPFSSQVGANSHSSKPPKEDTRHPAPKPAAAAPAATAPSADTATPAPSSATDSSTPVATPAATTADTTTPAATPADTTTPPPATPAPADSTSGTSAPPPTNR